MCGIAGILDLRTPRDIDPAVLGRMANAIYHRGPDEDGYFIQPGVGLASRRLSIVGLADGRQPIFNEDRSIVVVFNGELFDYVEKRAELEAKGHKFRTHADTEVFVHLWEEHGEDMFTMLRGQYGFCLYDMRQQQIILCRDRVGICPLHWAVRDDRLYFGSEIKAILASGEVPAELDPHGLDHIFTMFAMPTRRTCFKEISSIYAGSYVKIQLRPHGALAEVVERRYWDLDFPDRGDEYDSKNEEEVIDGFAEVFRRATEIRLRADVPVVSYLSGGLDSTSVLATATRIRGDKIPAFTVQIDADGLDETDRARIAGRTMGIEPTIVRADAATISATYPRLVQASECPVVDTSCAALYCLAGEVRRQGFKVALTGEGADEAFAGYPWFKINRIMNLFDGKSLKPSVWLRKLAAIVAAPSGVKNQLDRIYKTTGGPHAALELYNLVSMSRRRFYSPEWFESVNDRLAYEDLDLNLDRMKRWHPLNQSLYFGYKTMLPGLLLHQKGDRPAMGNSVETRYPFLDEDVIAWAAKLHPRWKLKGFMRDKHILRRYAARMLPPVITERPKAMFRAPFASTFFDKPPAYVEQLMSRESLAKSGMFNVDAVMKLREGYKKHPWWLGHRLSMEMGLTCVMATQLWRHTFLGGGLCELPTWAPENVESAGVLAASAAP